MTQRLAGRTAFVNGGASGIGRASAIRLATEGASVWITGRDAVRLDEAVAEAAQAGLMLRKLQADSGDARLDILVNNAGGSLQTPYLFEQESDDDWHRVLELNVMGTVRACRRAIAHMRTGGGGRIVNVGSKAGRFGSLVAGANYAASKGAISAMTRQLAMEFGPVGITVNCVCPGLVMTARTRARWESRKTPEERARLLQTIPLRRHAEAEDIAGAIAFLASDDAAFITGVTLDVNGGEVMA